MNGFEKVRFYHVPKTGGTSIFNMTTSWKNHKRAHPNHNHVKISKFPPKDNELAYAVTRHPYSRFISAFYHLVDACDDSFYYKNAKVSDCDWLTKHNINMKMFYNDPNEFLMALMFHKHPLHREARKLFFHFDIFKPQFYWLCDKKCRKIHESIKIILDQENLEDQFNEYIAKPLGENPNWPRGKSSNSRITREEIPLTEESKMIIQKLYPYDFEHFGHRR